MGAALPQELGAVWHSRKGHKTIGEFSRRATKSGKVLDGNTYKEHLMSFSLFDPEQRELRGDLMVAAAPHREQVGSAELSSL